jgi:hypothetical protein
LHSHPSNKMQAFGLRAIRQQHNTRCTMNGCIQQLCNCMTAPCTTTAACAADMPSLQTDTTTCTHITSRAPHNISLALQHKWASHPADNHHWPTSSSWMLYKAGKAKSNTLCKGLEQGMVTGVKQECCTTLHACQGWMRSSC